MENRLYYRDRKITVEIEFTSYHNGYYCEAWESATGLTLVSTKVHYSRAEAIEEINRLVLALDPVSTGS